MKRRTIELPTTLTGISALDEIMRGGAGRRSTDPNAVSTTQAFGINLILRVVRQVKFTHYAAILLLLAAQPTLVSAPLPVSVVFHASTDHAIVVSYLLEVFPNGSDLNTALPIASSDLGKPGLDANGDITVDRTTFFNALAPGTYLVTVSSMAPGGQGRSSAVTFQRLVVPNVVGLTQAAATIAITTARLTLGTVTTASSATVLAGRVISETPAAGTSVAAGSAVNLVVSSGPAPIGVVQVDGLVSSEGHGTRTTPQFSTSEANELLVAFAGSDGPERVKQRLTVSGAGLPWTLVRRANGQAGTAEIWVASAPQKLSSVSVTVTQALSGYHQSVTVVMFKGARSVGASNKASRSYGAPGVTLTTTTAGSLVYGVGHDWDRAVPRTIGSNQTMVHEWVNHSTNDTYWVQSWIGAVSPARTRIRLYDSWPIDDRWNFAAVEIVPRLRVTDMISSTSASTITVAGGHDLNGDGKTDISVFRPSTGTWYVRQSSLDDNTEEVAVFQWGLPGDVPISGDFDGDSEIELTVFRPSTGTWYVRYSSLGYSTDEADAFQWGLPEDLPFTGDFDGDGKTELTVFRPSTGTWYVRYSSLGYSTTNAEGVQWGLPGDLPVAADFDGDGKTELTVFRPQNGTWYIRYSSFDYSIATAAAFQWGLAEDVPVMGDFDGDGKTELTVFRPQTGTWYVRYSSQGYSTTTADAFQWGLPGDLAMAADFDGDGKTELTVYRPSTGIWYSRYSSLGYSSATYGASQWGLPGDALIK